MPSEVVSTPDIVADRPASGMSTARSPTRLSPEGVYVRSSSGARSPGAAITVFTEAGSASMVAASSALPAGQAVVVHAPAAAVPDWAARVTAESMRPCS